MKKNLIVTNPILNPAMQIIGQDVIEKVDGISEKPEGKESVSELTEEPKEKKEGKGKPGRPRVKIKKEQYTVTLKPELYEKAVALAEEMGISFSALATNALNEYLNK